MNSKIIWGKEMRAYVLEIQRRFQVMADNIESTCRAYQFCMDDIEEIKSHHDAPAEVAINISRNISTIWSHYKNRFQHYIHYVRRENLRVNEAERATITKPPYHNEGLNLLLVSIYSILAKSHCYSIKDLDLGDFKHIFEALKAKITALKETDISDEALNASITVLIKTLEHQFLPILIKYESYYSSSKIYKLSIQFHEQNDHGRATIYLDTSSYHFSYDDYISIVQSRLFDCLKQSFSKELTLSESMKLDVEKVLEICQSNLTTINPKEKSCQLLPITY